MQQHHRVRNQEVAHITCTEHVSTYAIFFLLACGVDELCLSRGRTEDDA